jgi:hypothetical protein
MRATYPTRSDVYKGATMARISLRIELDETDIKQAIAGIPDDFTDRMTTSPIAKIAIAIRDGYGNFLRQTLRVKRDRRRASAKNS